MDWEQFFKDLEGYTLTFHRGSDSKTVPVEEFCQAFKARMEAEIGATIEEVAAEKLAVRTEGDTEQ